MATPKNVFQRWHSSAKYSWPFEIYRKYNKELDSLYWSHVAARKRSYSKLKAEGATWADDPAAHFAFDTPRLAKMFETLKKWSEAYNDFENWVRLNALVAISGNVETYMAAVVSLAIQSDPGVLIGASRAIDGMAILKKNASNLEIAATIKSITKGDWPSRTAAFKRVFGSVPPVMLERTTDLDAMRRLRNKVGHAFGRDIAAAKSSGTRTVLPMERISHERMIRFKQSAWLTVKSVDSQLLQNHIGEFQILQQYSMFLTPARSSLHEHERAHRFRKHLGSTLAYSPGKQFCRDVVKFYDNLT